MARRPRGWARWDASVRRSGQDGPVVYTRAPAADRRRYDGRLPMRGWSWLSPPCWRCPPRRPRSVAWANAYEDGVEAFKKGNDALAEQKFKEARDHQRAPKQSRKANFSSASSIEPFIPDFYLGVIYAAPGPPQAGAGIPGAGAPRRARETGRPGRTTPWPRPACSARATSRRGWRRTSGRTRRRVHRPAADDDSSRRRPPPSPRRTTRSRRRRRTTRGPP